MENIVATNYINKAIHDRGIKGIVFSVDRLKKMGINPVFETTSGIYWKREDLDKLANNYELLNNFIAPKIDSALINAREIISQFYSHHHRPACRPILREAGINNYITQNHGRGVIALLNSEQADQLKKYMEKKKLTNTVKAKNNHSSINERLQKIEKMLSMMMEVWGMDLEDKQ